MKPLKYTLLIENGVIYLRFLTKDNAKGYCNIEAVPFKTGKSLDGLRHQGAKMAKYNHVNFEDHTKE